MWIIIDNESRLQDRSTKKGNLSRGYNYPGFKILFIKKMPTGLKIGDIYSPETNTFVAGPGVILSLEERRRVKIKKKLQEIAISALITDKDPDF